MKVSLDLARDLPKVRKQLPAVLANQRGFCEYSGPCVVGAMMPKRARPYMDSPDDTFDVEDTYIGTLIKHGLVKVPANQKRDFVALQKAFDSKDEERFLRALKRVEGKYLASGTEAGTGKTVGLDPKGDGPTAESGDAQ